MKKQSIKNQMDEIEFRRKLLIVFFAVHNLIDAEVISF